MDRPMPLDDLIKQYEEFRRGPLFKPVVGAFAIGLLAGALLTRLSRIPISKVAAVPSAPPRILGYTLPDLVRLGILGSGLFGQIKNYLKENEKKATGR